MPTRSGAVVALLAAVITLAATAASALAAKSPAGFPLTTPLAPSAGLPVASAASNHRLHLLLGLRSDSDGLSRYAAAASNPGSRLYRRYLPLAQIESRFGAPSSTRVEVIDYLRAQGVAAEDGFGGFWVEAEPTVAQATRLFSTHFATFRTADGERYVGASSASTVPTPLQRDVTTVVGLNEQPLLHNSSIRAKSSATKPLTTAQSVAFNAAARKSGGSPRANLGTSAGCAAARANGTETASGYVPPYTPDQYLNAYGYSALHAQGNSGQGQSVAVVAIDGFARADLDAAGECFGYVAPPTPLTVIGGGRALAPDTESTLDLQMLSVGAPSLSSIKVFEGSSQLSALAKLFAAPLALPADQRPAVISSSIGVCEHYLSASVSKMITTALTSAAALGVTVLSASGDQGSSDCGIGGSSAYAKLQVDFPASSPWVTAVGGTNITLDSANQTTEEVVWNDKPLVGFSGGGGGYSTLFKRPSWQSGPGVNVSRNRRIVPDVAMLADVMPGYAVYESGWGAVGGTSAATPLLAAGVALANQQAASAGKPALGFINPSIYTLASNGSTAPIFRDVTSGSNDLGKWINPKVRSGGTTYYTGGHNRPLGCCKATPNFDAASGWGSVNLPAFSAGLVSLR